MNESTRGTRQGDGARRDRRRDQEADLNRVPRERGVFEVQPPPMQLISAFSGEGDHARGASSSAGRTYDGVSELPGRAGARSLAGFRTNISADRFWSSAERRGAAHGTEQLRDRMNRLGARSGHLRLVLVAAIAVPVVISLSASPTNAALDGLTNFEIDSDTIVDRRIRNRLDIEVRRRTGHGFQRRELHRRGRRAARRRIVGFRSGLAPQLSQLELRLGLHGEHQDRRPDLGR